jgi:FlaA1/EpsC-like NDP-sugar epimerase
VSKPAATPARFVAPIAIYLHDLIMAAAAMGGSFLLRYHFEAKPTPYVAGLIATGLFTLVCAVVFPATGLERGVWRFTALNDILRCAQAAIAANLIFLPLLFLLNHRRHVDGGQFRPAVFRPPAGSGLGGRRSA